MCNIWGISEKVSLMKCCINQFDDNFLRIFLCGRRKKRRKDSSSTGNFNIYWKITKFKLKEKLNDKLMIIIRSL